LYSQVNPALPIVQKYGGTSVGNRDRVQSVAQRTKIYFDAGFKKLAVVVSAQSGETNRLVALIKELNPNPPADAYDMAVAAGEQVSVGLTCAALAAVGLKAVPLLAHQLGILTDEFHSKARILSIRTDAIEAAWQKGAVPVIAGFQGVTSDGEITTLGRGGSDTSAVALAVALKASFCEINTDVDGLFSADPRVVPNAQLLEVIDYEVALEMASLGSKVLHPRCVELGKKWSMPITVRNSFKSEQTQRTKIMPITSDQQLESPVVTGVSVDKDVLRVQVSGLPDQPDVLSRVFEAVAERGINLDIIVFDRHQSDKTIGLGFTALESDLPMVKAAMESLLHAFGSANVNWRHQSQLAKVSIVGVGMRSHTGVAQRAFAAIAKIGASISMVSTSEIKVSCVVPRDLADDAARSLHREFIEAAK
jgi:aspartate kinase